MLPPTHTSTDGLGSTAAPHDHQRRACKHGSCLQACLQASNPSLPSPHSLRPQHMTTHTYSTAPHGATATTTTVVGSDAAILFPAWPFFPVRRRDLDSRALGPPRLGHFQRRLGGVSSQARANQRRQPPRQGKEEEKRGPSLLVERCLPSEGNGGMILPGKPCRDRDSVSCMEICVRNGGVPFPPTSHLSTRFNDRTPFPTGIGIAIGTGDRLRTPRNRGSNRDLASHPAPRWRP